MVTQFDCILRLHIMVTHYGYLFWLHIIIAQYCGDMQWLHTMVTRNGYPLVVVTHNGYNYGNTLWKQIMVRHNVSK